MSLRALVENSVDLAYNVIGDLKVRGILRVKGGSYYDPDTHQVVSTSEPPKSIDVVVEEGKLDFSYNTPTDTVKVIVKRKDLPQDITLLDSIEINSKVFNIKSYDGNEYTVSLLLV